MFIINCMKLQRKQIFSLLAYTHPNKNIKIPNNIFNQNLSLNFPFGSYIDNTFDDKFDDNEGKILNLYRKPGEYIEINDLMCDIIFDKSCLEILAEGEGYFVKWNVKKNDIVNRNNLNNLYELK